MCVERAFPIEHLMLHTVLSILCELSHNHLAGGHYDFSHKDEGPWRRKPKEGPSSGMWQCWTWIQVFLTPGPGLLPPLLLRLRHHGSLTGASASLAVLYWPLYSLPFSLPQRTFKSISLTQTFLLNSKHVAAYWPFSPRCPGDIQETRGPKVSFLSFPLMVPLPSVLPFIYSFKYLGVLTRRKGRIFPFECRVPKNSQER